MKKKLDRKFSAKTSESKIPGWFARALFIAREADRLGLDFQETEWLIQWKTAGGDYNHWYVRFLYSKSMAVWQTRRKRIGDAHVE